MFELNQRQNGFVLVLEGIVDLGELQQIRFQLRDEWAGLDSGFYLMIDVRTFTLFTADAQALFEGMLEEARGHGLQRLTVLAVSTRLAAVFCNSMVRTDLMEIYQYMDTAYEPDWEEEVDEWLNHPPEVDV